MIEGLLHPLLDWLVFSLLGISIIDLAFFVFFARIAQTLFRPTA
jgi:hypothetical protein